MIPALLLTLLFRTERALDIATEHSWVRLGGDSFVTSSVSNYAVNSVAFLSENGLVRNVSNRARPPNQSYYDSSLAKIA